MRRVLVILQYCIAFVFRHNKIVPPRLSLSSPFHLPRISEPSTSHLRWYKPGLSSVYATPILRYSLDIPTIALHYLHDSPLLYEVAFPPSISLPSPFQRRSLKDHLRRTKGGLKEDSYSLLLSFFVLHCHLI